MTWDVAVVGAGPAGLSAAFAAASAGARTLVLEKAEHPRYKTCGGGLIGTSLAALAGRIEIPVHDHVNRVTFTADGRREFTRQHRPGPLLAMVRREEFDDRLRAAAVAAGAEIRQRAAVRAIDQDNDGVRIRLADGTEMHARVAVGADGSSGVSARAVGVQYSQVDLGLEVELPIPAPAQQQWRGRLLLDWGSIPGSYGWVFPKGDRLTVGVIAGRGQGEADPCLPPTLRRPARARRVGAGARLGPPDPVPQRGVPAAARPAAGRRGRGRTAGAVDPGGDQFRVALGHAGRCGGREWRPRRVRSRGTGAARAVDAGRSTGAGRLCPASRHLSRRAGHSAGLADVRQVLPR